MSELSKKCQRVAPVLIATATVAFIGWNALAPAKVPTNNFQCSFQAETTKAAPPFGEVTQPIISVRIVGHVGEPFDDILYEFAGTAVVELPDKTLKSPARGKVFIEKDGQPNGLLLTVNNGIFGQDGLHISTLDGDGRAEFSKTQAFIYSDPRPGAPLRLSYPARMNCSASIKK